MMTCSTPCPSISIFISRLPGSPMEIAIADADCGAMLRNSFSRPTLTQPGRTSSSLSIYRAESTQP